MSREQRERRAEADGVTVDRGDDRAPHREDVARDRDRVDEERGEAVVVRGALVVLLHLLEVTARAEAAPGAGDDHDFDLGVVGDARVEVADLAVHHVVDRVQAVGAVQRDAQDAVVVERR